jgi:hypothetical protein
MTKRRGLMIKSLIAAAALVAGTAGAADLKLDVDTAGNKVAVHVTIKNTGSQPIWVPVAIASDKELFGTNGSRSSPTAGKSSTRASWSSAVR